MPELYMQTTTIFLVISLCLLPATLICLGFLWWSLQKKVYELELEIFVLKYEIRSLKNEDTFF